MKIKYVILEDYVLACNNNDVIWKTKKDGYVLNIIAIAKGETYPLLSKKFRNFQDAEKFAKDFIIKYS